MWLSIWVWSIGVRDANSKINRTAIFVPTDIQRWQTRAGSYFSLVRPWWWGMCMRKCAVTKGVCVTRPGYTRLGSVCMLPQKIRHFEIASETIFGPNATRISYLYNFCSWWSNWAWTTCPTGHLLSFSKILNAEMWCELSQRLELVSSTLLSTELCAG